MLEWAGGEYDPSGFDLAAASAAVAGSDGGGLVAADAGKRAVAQRGLAGILVAVTEDFIAGYQRAAGRQSTRTEIQDAWAAGLWVRLFNAKKDAVEGSARSSTAWRARLTSDWPGRASRTRHPIARPRWQQRGRLSRDGNARPQHPAGKPVTVKHAHVLDDRR